MNKKIDIMKKFLLLLNVCMLLSIGSMYAEKKYYYAKVTASDGTVQWLKIGIDNSYKSWDADWTHRDIQGTLDLDEIYTETGGNGTKQSFSEIGSGAFFNFSGLTAVKGTSVTKLNNQAFDNCTSLASINFPNLQTIEEYSFGHCTSLKSYTIPESVTSIDGAAFYGCTNLTNLSVNSNSYFFSCENRILYNKNKTTIYAFLSSRTDTAYVVPSTVRTIGERAFCYNNYIKSIVLSNGVETIRSSAFVGSKIQSIYIPQSVTSIFGSVFTYCNSLTSVKVASSTPITLKSAIFNNTKTITLYVPQGSKEAYESANYWKDASNIVEYAPSPIIQFADANVKSVCVANWDYDGDGELSEEEAQEIREIGTQFQGNTDITSFNELQYFTNLKTIGTSAFSGCTNLESFTLPASLTKIGQYAFLNTAWLNAQPEGLVYIGNVLYTYKGTMPADTKIVVKDGTTCICNYAFYNQTNLIEIELPNSLLYLGTEDISLDEYGYVFSGCTGLTTIKIPAGVKDIIRYNFYRSGLKTVELPEGLESIGNSSFRSCTSLESIVIPDKVRTIGKNTFRDCSKLQQVTMPSSLMSVASDAFRGCGQLQRVDISNLSGWCNVDFADYRANPLTFAHHLYLDGKEVVEFETDSYCLLPYYNTYSNTWSYANYDWETIKPLVFYGCQSIKTVSIGKNITSIGNNAFYNCTGLKSVKTEYDPFTLSTSAFPTRANISLYTPQGCLDLYQEAAVWKDFKTVKSYPNLDVNEDGEVDVLDVVDIVNHTKGLSTSDAFVHFLADLNNDKKITIADAEWVAQRIPSTGRINELPATEGVTDIVLADNIQIRTGETNTASIQLQNTTDGLVGFQMDITLPDGISLIEKDCKLSSRITDAEQKLQIGKLSDNTFRLTATSLALQSFTENDGELINITLKATELSDGGTVNIKNIRIVTGNSERIVLADAALDIQIVDVTPTIAFQDEKVKAICLTNWDVNGDGELSMWEAAKVATIGTLFSGNTEITSFYELKHFVGLTTIDENAFLGCSNLESVSIPQNITTIGDKAFYDCNKLTGVYSYMTTPPAITETGFTNYTTATLYVCRNCKTAYENADVWKRFYSIVVMMFKEGAGTEESPYLLFDPSDFKNLATDVNAGTTYSGTYFKVAKKEIDFSGVSYTAIGKATYDSNGNEVPVAFSGNLDGNGVTIMNLSTNKALFGYIGKKGLVANITIDESCKINGYESNVAGIAGSNKGTIDNCINKAPVSCTKYHVGGICGDNMGTISNCKNYGAITCKSENGMTGGIAGDLDEGNILNCENYGDVVSDGFWIGGIVGLITRQDNGQSCSVKNCLNQGDVTGPYDVGGILGSITTSSSTYICDNMVSGCTIKGTRSSGTDVFGAGVIGMSIGPKTDSNNFYTPDVVLIVGNQTYDGTTPRGIWTYDSSTQSYKPADVTDNCAAMILPDAGTEKRPFTCAEANAFAAGLTADTPTETDYYVKGKVSTMQNNFGYQYGNATFYISDDGTKNGEFYVYRTLYFDKQNYNGGRVPNLGDEVVLYGKLTNYKGTTPETANNECRLVSINGKTVGTGLEVGDLFVAKTPEDVEMFFVVDESGKSMGKASETGCSVGYAVANKPETYTNPPCCINANYVGAITIPATAEGFPIQAIAPSAFTNSKLTSVTIPATVWDIETNAFKDCQNLTSVTMPEGVILNNGTFQNCTALTSIELPKDVQLWASEAIFGGCTNLTAITVNDETPYNLQGSYLVDDPSQVTLYVPVGSKAAYEAADYWNEFTIEEQTANIEFADANVKAICVANWDTDGDNELSEAEAAAVTTLGEVFKYNEEITSFDELQYFTGLTDIADHAFADCTSLTSVVLPGTVTHINEGAFEGCSKLASVDFNGCKAAIHSMAFIGCRSLTSLVLPAGCYPDGYSVFSGCSSLLSVEMKPCDNPVDIWSSDVFAECNNLKTATVYGRYLHGPGNFRNCSSLTNVTFIDDIPGNSFNQNFQGVPADVQFIIPDGSAETFLHNGYFNLSDKSGLGIVRDEFEAEAQRVAKIATTMTSGDATTLQTTISEARTVVNNATDYAEVLGQIDVIKQAARDFLATNELTGEVDVTGAFILNPDFDRFERGWQAPTGWITSGYQDGYCENGDVVIDHFIQIYREDWTEEGSIPNKLDDYQLSQAIHQLPAGNYRLEADCNASWPTDDRGITGAYLFIGDEQVPVTTLHGKPQHFSVEFANSATQDVEIGMKTLGTNANWIAFDNMRLILIEPIATEDEVLSVAEISAHSGKTADFTIDLTNVATDLTACQFDLTLPIGITLATNEKGKYLVTKTDRFGDDNQNLTVSKVEGSANTYRVISFSMNNEVISGTSGAILNAVLAVDADVSEDTYEGMITNIVLTKVDGVQLKPADAKFNIVVNNVIPGDANGDGDINVSDIVEIVNYILEKPSARFVAAAADLNGDGEINVTDIVRVVSIIMQSNTSAARQVSAMETTDNDQLTMAVDNDGVYSLHLSNEAQYVASQFEIRLGDGQTLEGVSLNDKRSDGHQVTYTQTGNNIYKVVVFSTENRPFDGNIGELLSFQVSGNGSIEVGNILFVTSGATEKLFPSLSAGTTGIDVTKKSDAMDIYSIDGRLVRRQATNTNGLKRGMYIINGKKTIVK